MSEGKKLIASVLHHESVSTFRSLTESLFIEDELEVFNFVRDYLNLYDELPSRQTAIEETGRRLPNVDQPPEFFLAKVRNRNAYTALSPIIERLQSSLLSRRVDQVRSVLQSALSTVNQHVGSDSRGQPIGEELDGSISRFREDRLRESLMGVPCGWEALDEDSRGYRNGDLVVWVARTGQGKSWAMLHQMRAARNAGRSCLFISMEMSTESIADRYLCLAAGIDPKRFRERQLSNNALRKLEQVQQEYQDENRINIVPGCFSKDIDEIESVIAQHEPDVIMIDSYYLLTPSKSSRYNSRYEKVAYLTDELKKLAVRIDRPVVVSTQFSRDAGKDGKKGSLESIGYTDAVGTHASLIYGILPGRTPDRTDRIVQVMKGREGETQGILINFKFNPIDFSQKGRVTFEGDLIHDEDESQYMEMMETMR